MTVTATERVSLEELLRPERDAVEAADAAYETALRTGAPDVTEARAAYKAAKSSYREAERAAFDAGRRWTCGRCGGEGIVRPWGTCFNCGGTGFHPAANPWKFDAEPPVRLKREAEFKQAQSEAEARMAASLAALPDDVSAALTAAAATFEELGGYYNGSREMTREESFRYTLHEKLRKYGSLSDAQIAAVRRGLERDAQRAAEEEALKAAPPLAGGTREIEGEVLTTKSQPGYAGGTVYKMLVKLDDGNKVWGTIPRAIDYVEIQDGVTRALDRGDRVAFTAQVERSADDPHFGFFKRPTKARIVKAAE